MLAFVLNNRQALINLGLWIIFLWIIYLAMTWALPFILPLVFGLMIAIILDPLVRLFGKLRVPRWLGALLAILIFFGGGTALILLLAARLVVELTDFVSSVPSLVGDLITDGQELFHRLSEYVVTLSPGVVNEVKLQLENLGSTIGQLGKDIAQGALNAITSVPTLVTIFLISLLIAFFVSKDFPLWKTRLLRFVHPTVQEKGSIVIGDLGDAVVGYVRAQSILITITFAQVLVGLLVLKVEYAFSLSLLAAFLDILPLLGTGSLFIPWAVYALVSGDTHLGIGLLVVYGFVIGVRQVLEARVLAGSIGLDPLVTIVAMYAAYQVIGFLGVILAPFIIILFASLLKVQAFHFLIDPDTTDNIPAKIIWRKEETDHV